MDKKLWKITYSNKTQYFVLAKEKEIAVALIEKHYQETESTIDQEECMDSVKLVGELLSAEDKSIVYSDIFLGVGLVAEYTEKWNKYKIGNIPWINANRNHLARQLFINYVKDNCGAIRSVLEIGAGECIEACALMDVVDYTVMDTSDLFLSHAKQLGLKTRKCDMVNCDEKYFEYDLIYMCGVIEHTPDITRTISGINNIGKKYYITMFRWGYNDNLSTWFEPKKKYYTSTFDIEKIFNLFGDAEEKIIVLKDGGVEQYECYEKNIDKTMKEHRNGNWLSFYGNCY